MIIVSDSKKLVISDLNLLLNIITFISDALDMDIDTELYKNKIVEDVFFINNTLSKIERNLGECNISEKDLIPILKKIKNVKDNTILLLENILKYKYKRSGIFESFTDNIKTILEIYKLSSAELQKKLSKKQFTSQQESQVSKEELYFLFMQKESQQ